MQRTPRRNPKRGSAVIEASLTLTVFLMFLLSLYDFAWVLFFHQTLVH